MARKYNISVNQYTTSGRVEVPRECNGWTAINMGDIPVSVQGISLYGGVPGTSAGDAIQIGGNEGEIFPEGQLRVVFDSASPGTVASVQIIFKFYVP